MKFNWKFEPAVWKGIITAVVSAALIWGVDLTEWGDKLQQTADVIGVLLPLIAGLWIRQSVTPNAKVAVTVAPGKPETVAGPALPVPDGTPVDVYAFPEDGEDYPSDPEGDAELEANDV